MTASTTGTLRERQKAEDEAFCMTCTVACRYTFMDKHRLFGLLLITGYSMAQNNIVTIEHLSKVYTERQIFNDTDFSINEG